jgi:hypothetical protein
LDPTGQEYIFTRQVETPMPVPPQVRAAFPLERYDDRMVCVVTGDVFWVSPIFMRNYTVRRFYLFW